MHTKVKEVKKKTDIAISKVLPAKKQNVVSGFSCTVLVVLYCSLGLSLTVVDNRNAISSRYKDLNFHYLSNPKARRKKQKY